MKKNLFRILKSILKIQSKIIPNKHFLDVIYLLSFVVLASLTQNALLIICSIALFIWIIVKGCFPKLDKLEHYYIGIVYFLVFSLPLVKLLGCSEIWYFLPALIFAAIKELFDGIGFGNPEVNDFIKTIQFSIMFYLLL